MFEFQGIWLPDGEKHFQGWMAKNGELVDGRGTYQIKKFREAMKHCKQFRTAVDVGAHVGLWSMQLHKRFQQTFAFEPVEAYRKCWAENMPAFPIGVGARMHALFPIALGAAPGLVAMKVPTLDGGLDTGGTHVSGVGDIEMRTLDSFELQNVDFIKIDCEGGELDVVRGGEATIRRCHPCMIVEQKPHKLGPNFGLKGIPAVDLLASWGAKVRREISGDFILSWDA